MGCFEEIRISGNPKPQTHIGISPCRHPSADRDEGVYQDPHLHGHPYPWYGYPLRGAPWGIWGNGMCPLGTSHLWIALIPGIRWSKYPIWDPQMRHFGTFRTTGIPHIPRSAEPVPDWGAEVLGTNSGLQEYPKWGLGNPYFRPMREDNGYPQLPGLPNGCQMAAERI